MTLPEQELTITIRARRRKAIERRHPWVFSGAVQAVAQEPRDGDIVTLRTGNGEFLARGYWNDRSDIRVRLLTWDPDEPIDRAFWRSRMQRAIQARTNHLNDPKQAPLTAYRLINAENDGVPGLIVDRYADYLVLQALTAGIDTHKQMLTELLVELVQPKGIYERSDVDIREKEGLPPVTGLLWGSEPPPLIEIDENGRHFLVDVRQGHKTGFYLDQRVNRAVIGDWLQRDPDASSRVILNAFSYTGGFAVYALSSLAGRVINVDSSSDSLALAQQNIALNGYDTNAEDFIEGDVFKVLRYFRDTGQQFDMIILDPPKFAHTPKQVQSAARGYKDINWLAFRLLKPGGLLATFSCSGAVSADLFQKIVFGAMIDSGQDGQIVQWLAQGSDHPVALTFPEGAYLKGLLCRVW